MKSETQFFADRPITAERSACSHCGNTVPRGMVEVDAGEQFCCAGCRAVHSIIHSCGLGQYYRLREGAAGSVPAAITPGRAYAEFDDEAFQSRYVKVPAPTRRSVDLLLQNVHCAACLWLIEKLPVVTRGVIEARLDLRRAVARIVWNPEETSLSAVARLLNSIGYPPHPARDADARRLRLMEDRRRLLQLAVAGACAGNVMLLALALYAGLFNGMDAAYAALFRWTSMGMTLVSLAWPGRVFFRGAWAALRTRSLHIDLPIAIGLGAGGAWGAVNTIRGAGEVYFDSLSVLVFALLLGRWVQHRQQRWSADAVELLFSLTPTRARRVGEDGGVLDVPIESVRRDDILEVLAGDAVPADGSVVAGCSSLDQSLLTGESTPVGVECGDPVCAGAVNLGSTLRIRVQAAGEETRVGKLMRMVEECSRRRAPIVRFADRISGWFVGAMLGLAAITAGAWSFIDPSRAIESAAALLIVTCPCALGLATPLAMTVAIGRAAKRGILIKGADALQPLASPGIIFLDKTGTITTGAMRLVSWRGDESVKAAVAAIEAQSSHPIARAIAAGLSDQAEQGEPSTDGRIGAPDQGLAAAVDVRQTLGGGIEGLVDGRAHAIGSRTFVSSRIACPSRGGLPGWAAAAEADFVATGLTPVFISRDGDVVAVAGVGDPIRPDARKAIDAIRAAGWRVRILSGDHPDLVRRVGQSLGFGPEEVTGGASPEMKLQLVQAAGGDGRAAPARRTTVVMVGDGVNDAAALAAANVGIAVHGGAEASLAAADIYLSQPGLRACVDLIGAAKRTMGVIRANLALSLFYNALAAMLAMTGAINPIIAAVLMPVSSLSVVANSCRARTFKSCAGESQVGGGSCR